MQMEREHGSPAAGHGSQNMEANTHTASYSVLADP